MRLLTIILLFLSGNALATNYYVNKTTGNDGAAGTFAAPWQNPSKVSAYSLSPGFLPGDTIFLNRGDVWIDSLRLYSGGTLGNPIVITAYGEGTKPELTGFRSLTMSSAGGNLWTGTATYSVAKQNTVLLNGSLGIKARYPNSNVLTYVTNTTAYVVIPHTATDYTGKEIAIYTATWELGTTKIAQHKTGATNDTLVYTEPTFYGSGRGGTGYFFQNSTAYLDTLNEYVIDSATKLLTAFATTSPTVQYSSIDTLIRVIGKSYIAIQNLKLTGANTVSVYVGNARGVTFDGCEINNTGEGVYTSGTNAFSFTNGVVQNSLNNAVSSFTDTAITVSNNTIDRIGLYPGMGKSMLNGLYYSSSGYCGISVRSDNFTISGNSITSVGYNPLRFFGRYGLIEKNYIKDFGSVKSDCGGIVTYTGSLTNEDSATVVKKNIIWNTAGNPTGVTGIIRAGIYLDQGTRYVTCDSNTIINQSTYSILAKGNNNVFRYNNIYDSTATANYYGQAEGTDAQAPGGSNTFTYNTVFTKSIPVIQLASFYDSVLQVFDYNNYYRFPNNSVCVYRFAVSCYTVAAFKAKAPTYDVNATYNSLPATAINTTPTIVYNNTFQDGLVFVSGDYVDTEGNIFHGAVYLKSFTSKILFPSTSVLQGRRRVGNLLFN